MKDYITYRIQEVAEYILETNQTIRQTAEHFGISKSTVHKDITERLKETDPLKAEEVEKILNYHKAIRHINGGRMTKLRYEAMKSKRAEE